MFCEEVFEILVGIYFPLSQDILFQHHTGWKPTSEQHIKLALASLLLPSITVYLSLTYSAVALPDSHVGGVWLRKLTGLLKVQIG